MVDRDLEVPADAPRGDTFNVVVVGAGIGGLLAAVGLRLDGHHVILLEQASSFGEVGAGIRIPPNSFKILHRWGVDLTYMKKTYSNGNRFLRYSDGEILADMPHGVPEWDFGGSYLMVHRADYHAVLLEKAKSLNVDIRGGSKVDDYDLDAPAAILEGGVCVKGDLIVVADGVQSKARPLFHGRELPPTDTGDVSYRVLIPGQDILADPDLRDLVSQPWVSSWCGPEAHVVGYPIRGGELYNVVFCCSQKSMRDRPFDIGENKTVITDNRELIRRFAGWEPRVKKITDLAGQNILKWQLFDLDLVDHWVHPSGKATLLGDAVHPTLPYMASGAAMACEDAAALKQALRGATRETLTSALSKYQEVRQPRASVVQKAGRTLQDAYHLHDGERQRERDYWITKDDPKNPIFWGCKERRGWLFGHDAESL
ncbi:FAD/NAD(P)-binding domain-containing protein [Durotheca rogersii]|uniref:FAD/NAD(P)-binding domain-containing protein n=1 Tax=Durotheca rogersii TaxID=419775 RepID=UPI002220322B|nr:FAD/NAD(P)-binding domain-containing protein [Durotheca rogersii]KAI5857329.1 FAD/NAD(P)-binding domain-containing protein [Durotheca rogersii]